MYGHTKLFSKKKKKSHSKFLRGQGIKTQKSFVVYFENDYYKNLQVYYCLNQYKKILLSA